MIIAMAFFSHSSKQNKTKNEDLTQKPQKCDQNATKWWFTLFMRGSSSS